MSWLDLAAMGGGALLGAGGLVAAPFTGGASLGLTAAGAGLVGAGMSGLAGEQQADAATQAGRTQADAATQAAQTQATGATNAAQIAAAQNQKGIDFAQGVYNTSKTNSQPYIDAGSSALGSMQGILAKGAPSLSDLQMDPGYGWRLSQGLDALQASAAARGGLLSGNTLTGINNYAQGSASQEYANAYGRYMDKRQQDINGFGSVAGMGTSALNSLNAAGGNIANTVGGLYQNTGATQAAGITGAANSTASGYMGAANATAQGGINAAGANSAGMMGAANSLSAGASSYANINQSNSLLAALKPKTDPTTAAPYTEGLVPGSQGNIPTQYGNSMERPNSVLDGPYAPPGGYPAAPPRSIYSRPVPYYGY